MQADNDTKALLLLAEASTCFPVPVEPRLIRGYITRGLAGVRLEAVYVAGRWLTSRAAIGRFLAAVAAARVARVRRAPDAAARTGSAA